MKNHIRREEVMGKKVAGIIIFLAGFGYLLLESDSSDLASKNKESVKVAKLHKNEISEPTMREEEDPFLQRSKKKVNDTNVEKVEKITVELDEVEKPKVSQPHLKEHLSAKVEKKDVMDEVVVSDKSIEILKNVESSDEIGESLTLEGIENADVSDEEKERMRDDLAYQKSFDIAPSNNLTDEEVIKLIDTGVNDGML
jgi:hypothetical protein